LPFADDARSIAEIGSCETYRATNDLFLDIVGSSFHTRSSDFPDTDPLIYYIQNDEIYAVYQEVYLQSGPAGGLYQRFPASGTSLEPGERYHAMYISTGVATRYVAAHEFNHYLFARHVLPRDPSYDSIMQLIDEGLANYVAYHAFEDSAPDASTLSLICGDPDSYPTLSSILAGDSFGLDYDLAYVYVYFLINREPAIFARLLAAFRDNAFREVDGSLLTIGDEQFDIDTLDAGLHALFDEDTFCVEG